MCYIYSRCHVKKVVQCNIHKYINIGHVISTVFTSIIIRVRCSNFAKVHCANLTRDFYRPATTVGRATTILLWNGYRIYGAKNEFKNFTTEYEKQK